MPTPYGTIKVFEFGPLPTGDGERVLLLPGISTPCIALANLATALADQGFRVLLFDYFGRGWSDTPDPADVDHDAALYITQILAVVATASSSSFGCFHVMGYSFGGGLAVSFASYYPQLVRSVTLIAPGGLMPWRGNSWRTRMLYFTRGIFPEWVLQYFVRRRFAPAAATAVPANQQQRRPNDVQDGGGDDDNNKNDHDVAAILVEQAETGSDPFDSAVVATRKCSSSSGETSSQAQVPITVADVMAWQLQHHQGFVPAVMSAFRYGPIHERYEEWGRLGEFLTARRQRHRQRPLRLDDRGREPALEGLLGGKVLLVLGQSDSIVREERLVPEMKRVLGDDAVEVVVLEAGHEVAITKGVEIANAALEFWHSLLQ